jgi:hypothetical protein
MSGQYRQKIINTGGGGGRGVNECVENHNVLCVKYCHTLYLVSTHLETLINMRDMQNHVHIS